MENYGSDRDRARAIAGTAAFGIAPLTVAGIVPAVIARRWAARHPGRRRPPAAVRAVGWAMSVAGVAVAAQAFGRFAVEGLGTPLPLAPTRNLVVSGAYRYVRNPMYVALAGAVLGHALRTGSPPLYAYAAAVLVPTATFVRLYEEPKLLATYGEEFETYRRHVPGWIPRLTPWRG